MKVKKTDEQTIKDFWESPPDSLHNESEVALIRRVSTSKLAHERMENKGPKFLKIFGQVVYRKRDVEEFINGFDK